MEKRHSHFDLHLSLFLLAMFIFYSPISARSVKRIKPCRSLVLYFHDILYDGKNQGNATSAIVSAPAWVKGAMPDPLKSFGNIVIFDDPITLDNNLHSPPVERAQGLYFYDSKVIYTAWFGFSLVINSSDYKGSINLVGADPFTYKTRDVSVVGGTGDFFMTRGIATFTTDSMEGTVYFRLRLDIKLYECY